MAAPIHISHASSSHFDHRQPGEDYLSLPSAVPALPVSMNADQVSSLNMTFSGAPRASDLLAHQLQSLKTDSAKPSRRSRHPSLSETDLPRLCTENRSPSKERESQNVLMRLKGAPSLAQPSIFNSMGKLSIQTSRDRSLSPAESSTSPADSCAFSPPEIMTPHSVLFHRLPEGNAGDMVTPGSSWSSCSKCSGDSMETTETVTTSLDALDESHVSQDDKNLAPLGLPIEPTPSRRPAFGRQRSKSDIIARPDNWSFLQDDTKTIGAPSDSESGTASPVRSLSSSPEDTGALIRTSAFSLPNNNRTHADVERSASEPKDFSAYVSGIGTPIDPDTEFSSVAQLQTFRIHSRSRSVGPGDIRSERLSTGHQYTSPFDISSRYGISSRERSRVLSPRPPLLNVRDTELIPSLSALGTAVCNPGYNLKPHPGANESRISSDEHAPPASPRLRAHPEAPVMINGVLQLNAIPDASVDENGFQTVISRGERRRQRTDTSRASRPPAEEPVPISLDAIPEPDERPRSEVDEEDERGRTRGRGRRGRATTTNSKPLGATLFNASGSVTASRGSRSRRSNRARTSGMSYAAVATAGRDQTPANATGASESRTRGRCGAVKVVNSSEKESSLSSVSPPPSVPEIPINEANEEENTLHRPRLLSNSAHLLMLSLELAMIRNNKITAPLKPRWGKRRDDDFRPIPNSQTRFKLLLSRDQSPTNTPMSPSKDICPLMDQCGSNLKHVWMPSS